MPFQPMIIFRTQWGESVRRGQRVTTTLESTESSSREREFLPGFFSIPLATLLVGEPLSFTIHFSLPEGALRFCPAGATFDDEQRQDLSARGIEHVFVEDAAHEDYLVYVQKNIRRLLNARDGSRRERNQRLVSAASATIRHLYLQPQSTACAQATRDVAEATMERVHLDEGLVGQLNQLLAPRPDLHLHSLHVCFYGLTLARSYGIQKQEALIDLGTGLLIHDLGKLDAEFARFDNELPLDESGWKLMHTHPAGGLARIEKNPVIGPIARDAILNHHERCDGSGYPEGKTAKELSIHAQIAALANTFARRTTDTPYRPAQKTRDALQKLILEERGRFDAKLLAHLVRALSQ